MKQQRRHRNVGAGRRYFYLLYSQLMCLIFSYVCIQHVPIMVAAFRLHPVIVSHPQNSRQNMQPKLYRPLERADAASHNNLHILRKCDRKGPIPLYESAPKSFASDQSATTAPSKKRQARDHALAILTMPHNSMDRIANEAILNQVLSVCDQSNCKLSVVLRCQSSASSKKPRPSLSALRRYVGEIYSQLWDCCLEKAAASNDKNQQKSTENKDDGKSNENEPSSPTFTSTTLTDVCVYAQNMPNTAPESWIHIQPDLTIICSHDSVTGWTSNTQQPLSAASSTKNRGSKFQNTPSRGLGGLQDHVQAVNAERKQRGLEPVTALEVERWPAAAAVASISGANDEAVLRNFVVFVDDDDEDDETSSSSTSTEMGTLLSPETLLGGARMSSSPSLSSKSAGPVPRQLFDSVAVGGTFDGLHFGHRKLLTLAVSSINPITGRLLVGVTEDAMLTHKQFSEYLPPYDERVEQVKSFLHRLAPGMMNRVKIVPLSDAYGPLGDPDQAADFEALVLSHETLETGYQLNKHRVETLEVSPVTLLCTRRTEAYGMSSTTLRRLRSQEAAQQQRSKT